MCKSLTAEEKLDFDYEKAWDEKNEEYFKGNRERNERNSDWAEKIINDGDINHVLNRFDTKKIYNDALSKGIENEVSVQSLIKAIDEAKKSIKPNMAEKDAKKEICRIFKYIKKGEMDLDALDFDDPKNIKSAVEPYYSDFKDFLSLYGKTIGIDGFDADGDSCLLLD